MGSSRSCYNIGCTIMVPLLLLLGSTWITHTWALPAIDATNDAPIIIPSEPDVTLEIGVEYNLTCRSTKPVTWRLPEIHVEHTIISFERSGSDLPHGSVLTLHNVQVENVGKYYCIDTEFNTTKDFGLEILIGFNRAKTIYVYVNDPEHLIVPVEIVVMATQYADVIIPCKPSSKNVQVQLLREDESALDMPNRYDPTVGYIAKMIHLNDGGTFICRPKSDYYQITYIEVRVHGCELRNNKCSENVVMVAKKSNDNTTSNFSNNETSAINPITSSSSTTFATYNISHVNASRINLSSFTLRTSTLTTPSKLNRVTRNSQSLIGHASSNITTPTSSTTISSTTTATNKMFDASSSAFGRKRRGPELRRRNSHTDFINRPTIKSDTNGHAIKGETLTLECSVDIRPSIQFSINWTLPNNNAAVKDGRATVTETMKYHYPETTELEIGRNKLIVHNVNEMDAGFYSCGVIDHSGNYNNETLFVKILRPDESYINMTEPSNHYTIETSVKKRRTKMLVKYKAYPSPTLVWYNSQNEPITPSGKKGDESVEKYNVERTADSILLEIRNIALGDSGTYTLKADNEDVQKELKFQVFIKDKPTVQMEDAYYVQEGGEANLVCECVGYPKPQITWTWIPCQIKPKWPNCFPASSSKFEFKEVIVPENTDVLEELENNSYRSVEKTILLQHSELKFTPNQPGFVKCSAKNSEGNDTFDAAILLGDLNESFAIYGIPDNHVIAAGDNVVLTCGVLAYNYSANIDWYKNDSLIESNSDDLQIDYSESEYSYKKKLVMKNIDYDQSGLYECRANLIDDNVTPESRFITIQVHEPEAPVVTHSNLNGAQVGKKLGEVLNLECQYKGIPDPLISWFKDDVRIEPDKNSTRLFLEQRNSRLSIPFIKPEDEGTYKCVVSNRLGSVERMASVKISNLPSLPLVGTLLIIGLFIVLVILIIYLCIRFCREKKLRKELKAAGLANFEEGAVECINNALSLDEQADLLPYDRRFEFPKEKLKLGKQLGAGAFGVVLKALAEGILPDEKDTTVAVKMVKKTADNEVMKALVSELKIMVHLGQHLNVVNLLGAVTKNIAKREVMVIVEYCRYGNVQSFLLKNRKNFINQINRKTDQIDPLIITKEMRFSGDYDYNSQGLKYAKLSFSNPHLNNNSRQSGDMGTNYSRDAGFDYVSANMNSATTEMTTIPGEENIILSNNSIQPAWRSNYRPDDITAMDINTTQLVSWAFQVARGMDYLASRKVLHGDLAARNILLCDENVVKICDFGLARSMYKSDNYKKHGEAPLPIKWLALESMSDQVFSTYSDIWSFGIVLWEFFSLAKVPYPGMDADENLYLKLKDGYRMEQPEYANQDLYDIMLECWSTNPEMRPAFNILEKRFARMLGDDITNHYVDLNDPYLRVNSDYFTNGNTDYLAMMGCPDEVAPQAPRYVNGKMMAEMAANNSGENHYVQMQPKTGNAIFSPRPQVDEIRTDHFTFPPPISPTISHNLDSPSSKNRKKGVIPEEVPMLNRSAGSDSESELSPDVVSSPSKQFSSLNKMPDPKARISGDNYVNVTGSDINKSRTKDAFSNPEYLMLNNVNEKRK